MSNDKPEKNANLAQKVDFPFQLWSDGDTTMAVAYGAAADASASAAKRIS